VSGSEHWKKEEEEEEEEEEEDEVTGHTNKELNE